MKIEFTDAQIERMSRAIAAIRTLDSYTPKTLLEIPAIVGSYSNDYRGAGAEVESITKPAIAKFAQSVHCAASEAFAEIRQGLRAVADGNDVKQGE